MGPTNIALVKLFLAEREIRAAQARLDDAAKNLRLAERRVADAAEKYGVCSSKLKEEQAACSNLELDVKTRDAHIERLRTQQQTAKNNKEYQAFLVEINTEKVEKGKVEDLTIKAMEELEKTTAEARQLQGVLETETARLEKIKSEIAGKLAALQAEVDSLKPARDAAAEQVPPAARQAFTRLAERFDGEGLSALTKPDRRREQYACGVCNMDLVTDIYNKLHSRDDLVFCPSCHRILYIPDDMPPEVAVNTKPKRAEKKTESAA
ncbi:MAG TPA: C4-type zinc ribbon domain-containing protein [Tepidisphaeraceae bacterium]|nr:C4-type zinc ribbon domain-containing protein [Tepidisphaeraceae bacterium]